MTIMQDIFITFVANDKGLVNTLSDELEAAGMSVSFHMLDLGDSLTANIKEGFQEATFGVIIMSQALFKLPWPRQEIEMVASIEQEPSLAGRFMAIWHQIEPEEAARVSPALARLPGLPSEIGLEKAAHEIAQAASAAAAGQLETKQSFYKQMPIEQSAPLSSDPHRLAQILRDQFSLGELQDLSFEMGVNFDDLGGGSKAGKSRELVNYVQRRGKLDELAQNVMLRRPYLR
jgi:hypothetical protein